MKQKKEERRMKKTIGWILIIIGGFHCICGIICIPVAFIADDVTFAERIFILIGFMVFAFVNGLICRFGFKLKKS